MTKAGKTWSWLKAKMGGSGSPRRSGPPFKELPRIPVPSARKKARYSVVIIGESGSSRQLDLTPLRVRVLVGAIVAVIAVTVVSAAISVRYISQEVSGDVTSPASAKRVNSLEEELAQKEVEISVYKDQLAAAKAASSSATSASNQEFSLPAGSAARGPKVEHRDSGPAAETDPSSDPLIPPALHAGKSGPGTNTIGRDPGRKTAESAGSSVPVSLHPPPLTRPAPARSPISFNARQMTADSEPNGNGQLRFRLTKDRPGVKFKGYLFVYMHLVGRNGQNKLYVYPGSTRLGEGDLPSDYRDGRKVSFKNYRNVKVNLPRRDSRRGPSLSRISILLYGRDGNIVFQRGFEGRKLNWISRTAAGVKRIRPTRAGVRLGM